MSEKLPVTIFLTHETLAMLRHEKVPHQPDAPPTVNTILDAAKEGVRAQCANAKKTAETSSEPSSSSFELTVRDLESLRGATLQVDANTTPRQLAKLVKENMGRPMETQQLSYRQFCLWNGSFQAGERGVDLTISLAGIHPPNPAKLTVRNSILLFEADSHTVLYCAGRRGGVFGKRD